MNGHRPRDSYRTRVFTAETEVRDRTTTPSLKNSYLPQFNETEARHFLKQIEASRYWQNRADQHVVPRQLDVSYRMVTTVCDKERAPACAVLRLGVGQRDRLGLLHALAHHVAPTDESLHGVGFGKAVLELAKQFAPDLHPHVKDAYRAHKVKTRTRTMSPEAKEAAADRLRSRHATDKKADLLELLDELSE